MRHAIVENGKVVDFIDVEAAAAEPNWIICSDEVQVGWLYQSGEFSAPVLHRFAVVVNGWVDSVVEAFEANDVHWIECGPEVQVDWQYIDGQFVAPTIKRWAIVSSGVVVNAVLGARPMDSNWVECSTDISLGATYSNGEFTNPAQPPAIEPAASDKRITQFAFRQRFTWAEKISIESAAEIDAELRVLLADQKAAQYMDLDYPATQQGLQLLVDKGLLTIERGTEILSAPVMPEER